MKLVYKNIDEYKTGKKRKALVVFDDMIVNMLNNRKLERKFRKLLFVINKHFAYFYYFYYYAVPKSINLNSAKHLIVKATNTRSFNNLYLIKYLIFDLKTL